MKVLPVIGLILQAPFESNKNFNSFLALSRWIGYVLFMEGLLLLDWES